MSRVPPRLTGRLPQHEHGLSSTPEVIEAGPLLYQHARQQRAAGGTHRGERFDKEGVCLFGAGVHHHVDHGLPNAGLSGKLHVAHREGSVERALPKKHGLGTIELQTDELGGSDLRGNPVTSRRQGLDQRTCRVGTARLRGRTTEAGLTDPKHGL